MVLFVLSGLLYGAVYGYTLLIDREIENMGAQLEEQWQQIRPAEIAEYKRFDDRLKVAESILNNHIVLSEIFTLLSEHTLPTIRYTDFSFSKDAIAATETEVDGEIVRTPATERLTILLTGEATKFEDIALQEEEFKKNEFIKNAAFSSFQLNESGALSFSVEAVLEPSLVGYLSAVSRAPEEPQLEAFGTEEEFTGDPAAEDEAALIPEEEDGM